MLEVAHVYVIGFNLRYKCDNYQTYYQGKKVG